MVLVVQRFDALDLEFLVVIGEGRCVESVILLGIRWAIKTSVQFTTYAFLFFMWGMWSQAGDTMEALTL